MKTSLNKQPQKEKNIKKKEHKNNNHFFYLCMFVFGVLLRCFFCLVWSSSYSRLGRVLFYEKMVITSRPEPLTNRTLSRPSVTAFMKAMSVHTPRTYKLYTRKQQQQQKRKNVNKQLTIVCRRAEYFGRFRYVHENKRGTLGLLEYLLVELNCRVHLANGLRLEDRRSTRWRVVLWRAGVSGSTSGRGRRRR